MLAVEQGQPGEEADAGAAGGHELFAGLLEAVGLAEYPSVEYRDLVRADDQVRRMEAGQGPGLFLGQAFDQRDGGFARVLAFVDVR